MSEKFSSGTKYPKQTHKRLKLCFSIMNLAMCFKINNPLLYMYIHGKTWVRFQLIDKLYKPYVWRVGWNMVFCPRIKVVFCPFHWWDYSLVLTPMYIKTKWFMQRDRVKPPNTHISFVNVTALRICPWNWWCPVPH